MSEQDRAAALAGTNNPSPAVRAVTSRVSRLLASSKRRNALRRMRELRRRLSGSPHRVEYFHQTDDPYSHLAIQLLEKLRSAYEIELTIHLVRAQTDSANPEPELLLEYARRDSEAIAPHRGVHFQDPGAIPPSESVELAERLLVAANRKGRFVEESVEIGEALWSGDPGRLTKLDERSSAATPEQTQASIQCGTDRRTKQSHYSGAMFLYGGEWYWGVDRIDHLERRLQDLGAARPGSQTPIAPRPALEFGPGRDEANRLTLEYFPSLRSPYTSFIHDSVVRMVKETGVRLVIRPVLPMVMRGVSITFAKASYIMTDAAREAESLQVPFGKMYDPIGEPVEQGFSLYPFAEAQGKGAEFVSSFLRAAFAEGINTGTESGLRHVVERAGLDWQEAQIHLGKEGWREVLEANRLTMVDNLGLWGVPSYRLQGPGDEPEFSAWGQDRLWLVGREIQRRVAL